MSRGCAGSASVPPAPRARPCPQLFAPRDPTSTPAPSLQVRKLSEERDWLASQLLEGPAPDVPPHRLLLPGGAAAPRPLQRHLSF